MRTFSSQHGLASHNMAFIAVFIKIGYVVLYLLGGNTVYTLPYCFPFTHRKEKNIFQRRVEALDCTVYQSVCMCV